MNRTVISSLAAGLVAVAALAAPAQAGYKSHFHGHHHVVKKVHVHKFHHFHKFHAYRHVYHKPVCVKFDWVYSYGHKTWACVIWK